MADQQTQLIISIETILKGLDKTLRGLSQVEKQLRTVASIKVGGQTAGSSFDKATAAAQRLSQQQQRLSIQSQELANRQQRAALQADRLALSQLRLEKALAKTADTEQRASKASAATSARAVNDANRRAAQVARINAQTARQAEQQEALRTRAAKTIADVQTKEAQRGATAFITSLGAQSQVTAAFTKRIEAFGNSLRSIGQGLSSVGISLSAALTAPLVALGVSVTNAAVSMDSLKRGLTAIVGSSAEAEKQLTRLTEIAKLPGIGFEEAIQGSIRLQAVGFSAEEAEKSLRQFANAVALTGGGREELTRVTVQLGQLAAKGKVLSQDLRPIIEAAPAVGRALLEAFGTVNASDIQELGLSSKEFLAVLTDQLSKLPRAAAGAKNAFENFRDTLFRAAATVGDAVLPILSKLIDVLGPAITSLAEGFRSLPAPLQTAVILFGGLAAAAGPVLFIVGQLSTGIGRLIVGFAQLSASGILPTIRNLGTLATASVATAEAETTLAASTALLGASFLGIAALLGAVVVAYIALSDATEEATAVDVAAAAARKERLDATQSELEFLRDLTKQVSLTADQQDSLTAIYNSLTGAARGRVAIIDDEMKKLEALIEAKRQQIALDTFAQQSTSLALAEAVTKALDEQRKAQEELTNAKKDFENATIADITASGKVIRFAEGTKEALDAQSAASERANTALDDLAKKKETLDGTRKAIIDLSNATGISTDTLLEQAKAAGKDEKEIQAVRDALKDFTAEQKDAAPAVNSTTKALLDQAGAFVSLGKAAEEAKKTDEEVIKGMIAFFSQVSKTPAEFNKNLDEALKKFPELSNALQRLRKEQSFSDTFNKLIGKGGKKDTAFRNAQEQLAQATAAVAKAAADQQRQTNKDANEKLLQQNESNFKLQLIAYRQYLNEKTRLTNSNLNEEIKAQSELVTDALIEQQRFLDRAGRAGLPKAERTKAEAGAAHAEEDAIKAGIRINELREQQKRNIEAIDQVLAESAKQQLEDVRKLRIEYAELTNRIEDALNAATDEKFIETLKALALAQEDLNKRLEVAKEIHDADAIERLTAAKKLNQEQIELERGIVDQERATNRLSVANILVQRSQEQQRQLEQDIAFEVEFRGLKEIDAVNKRIAGEEKLRNSLLVTKEIIEDTVKGLEARGIKPPQALLDFIRDTNLAVKGLGEIGFSEQFRLAEAEFTKLNDARLLAIADVERAVRHRDLAEIEGRILIKKLNGEYVADLEKQAAVLKAIADKSGQEGLKRQAEDAGQLAKDVRAATTEVADFGKQLRSVSLDALRDGFAQFFKDLTDRTKSIKEDLLGLVNSVVGRLADLAAESLADKAVGGLSKLFGLKTPETATDNNTTATEENTAAINGLNTALGGTATATTGTTGIGNVVGGSAGKIIGQAGGLLKDLGIKLPGIGGDLLNTVAPAGSTLLEALNINSDELNKSTQAIQELIQALNDSASSDSQQGAAGLLSGLFNSGGGEATGNIIPAAPQGRLIRVAEAGYDEAVLTTDPKHAVRQAGILNEYLRRTRGLFGRFKVPEFATGGMLSAREAEQQMLATAVRMPTMLPRLPQDFAVATADRPSLNLRNINVFDRGQVVRGHLRSAEGARDILNIISENADDIGRRIGVK